MQPVFKLENSVATFITTNTSLVEAAKEYDAVEFGERRVPAAITEYSLANFAWIKSPSLASSSLPLREVLAFAKAALQPSERFWEAYVDAIEAARGDGRITPENYASLRYSPWAREELMITTMGLPSRLTEVSLGSILEQVSRPIGSEEILRLAKVVSATEMERDEFKRERDHAVSMASQNLQRADVAERAREEQLIDNFCRCVSVVGIAHSRAFIVALFSDFVFLVVCLLLSYLPFSGFSEATKFFLTAVVGFFVTYLGINFYGVHRKVYSAYVLAYCKKNLRCACSESEVSIHISEYSENKKKCDSRLLVMK